MPCAALSIQFFPSEFELRSAGVVNSDKSRRAVHAIPLSGELITKGHTVGSVVDYGVADHVGLAADQEACASPG
jgi:hypothetical protein